MNTAMATKPKRMTNWRIDVETLEQLEALAQRMEVSKSDIMRLSLAVGISSLERFLDEGKSALGAMAAFEELGSRPQD